ncbi:MAG: hypothetical protein HW404_2159, partial [Anaerolineales bacterium]|nr:hypothetical protein [Anaerolineales bacterium]
MAPIEARQIHVAHLAQDANLPLRLDLRLLRQAQGIGQRAAGLLDLGHLAEEVGQLQELVEGLVSALLLRQQLDQARARIQV